MYFPTFKMRLHVGHVIFSARNRSPCGLLCCTRDELHALCRPRLSRSPSHTSKLVVYDKRAGRKRNSEVHAVNPRPGVPRPGAGTRDRSGCRRLVRTARARCPESRPGALGARKTPGLQFSLAYPFMYTMHQTRQFRLTDRQRRTHRLYWWIC